MQLVPESSVMHRSSSFANFVVAAVLIAFVANRASASDGPAWSTTIEEGQRKAKADNKDLFLLFTGHGWCIACDVQEREVFRTEEFVAATKEDFAFVEFDHNFGESKEDKQRAKVHKEIEVKYLSRSVPTVVLADQTGVPFAIRTGYEAGEGVGEILTFIASAQAARMRRDAFYEAAESSNGLEKATLLDQAIGLMQPLLGTIDERQDDPILVFYADQVKQIFQLTPDGNPLRVKYEQRLEFRDRWKSSRDVLAELDKFSGKRDYSGAIEFIDGALHASQNEDVRWQLEIARQVYLEWSERFDEALKNSRRLLQMPSISHENREKLLDREAYNLFRLHHFDEGLPRYDERIAGAQKKLIRLHRMKASAISNHTDRTGESIAVFLAYRHATVHGTKEWLDATIGLAHQFQKDERHEESLRLLDACLKFEESDNKVWTLLCMLESHLALGHKEKSRQLLTDISQISSGFSASERESDRRNGNAIDERLALLTRDLSKD
ncbi:thioredoxin family protein [Rhodopirellula bahusiensis]|uniref:thioredoxin family protein n=1 Tax=Rhodopirellula bahusiensis TaxID=2014065 RepID=UPI003263F3AD